VVVDTGGDEKSPIIYAEHAKIVFIIKDKKEKFSFRSQMLHIPA
jgi:hypothetical protein